MTSKNHGPNFLVPAFLKIKLFFRFTGKISFLGLFFSFLETAHSRPKKYSIWKPGCVVNWFWMSDCNNLLFWNESNIWTNFAVVINVCLQKIRVVHFYSMKSSQQIFLHWYLTPTNTIQCWVLWEFQQVFESNYSSHWFQSRIISDICIKTPLLRDAKNHVALFATNVSQLLPSFSLLIKVFLRICPVKTEIKGWTRFSLTRFSITCLLREKSLAEGGGVWGVSRGYGRILQGEALAEVCRKSPPHRKWMWCFSVYISSKCCPKGTEPAFQVHIVQYEPKSVVECILLDTEL